MSLQVARAAAAGNAAVHDCVHGSLQGAAVCSGDRVWGLGFLV